MKDCISADGVKVVPGMDVWVHDKSSNTISPKKVGSLDPSGHKIMYDIQDTHGYIGARITGVYVDKAKAEQAIKDYEEEWNS